MVISVGKNIRCQIAKNLLSAHGQIADSGNVNALIVLTKFIARPEAPLFIQRRCAGILGTRL